jgi:hypothetical protein
MHKPIPPTPTNPPSEWNFYELWERIKTLLQELPNYFKSTLNIISAVNVTEIYAFGQALSHTIEEEVVRTLNHTKKIWDPSEKYCDCRFIRQPQSFPDVLLLDSKTNEIVMGIELKSWYLLAKEGEPSFRYKVACEACAPQDLLVVVPWALSSVVTGIPIILKPFVTLAKYAAEYRNYWWKYLRNTKDNVEIRHPEKVSNYPSSRERIDDEPIYDPGNNFGRLARTEIMDEWIKDCKRERLLGIEIEKWIEFFKTGTVMYKETCGGQLQIFRDISGS